MSVQRAEHYTALRGLRKAQKAARDAMKARDLHAYAEALDTIAYWTRQRETIRAEYMERVGA